MDGATHYSIFTFLLAVSKIVLYSCSKENNGEVQFSEEELNWL